jgi:hypothetical protein
MTVKEYTKGDKTKLSENFNVSEFACHGSGCCSTVKIDELLVFYLQKIREHFGKPVTITSGYRCEKHNKRVGGATASRHAAGMAADIVVKDVAPAEVAKYAESIGIKGIGLYETAKDGFFTHIDTRMYETFWYGQGQAHRSTFGGKPINTAPSKKEDSAPSYTVGKTYKTQVDNLSVRTGAGTNYTRKTYAQLSSNARKNATKAGYLKKGVSVTCLEVKKVGSDIWIRIPSGWCAAYYNGKYYIK